MWPRRPYPPKPHVWNLPSASTAIVWLCPDATLVILRPTSAEMTSGCGCASYASLTEDVAMLYSPSVPCPSCPYWGRPAERRRPSSPQIHMVNSAPHDTAVHALTEHWTGARRLSSSLGLVLAMLPTPSCPCLLLPHAYALPSAVTTTVCDLPQAPSTTLMPASALTSVGADLLSTSPRPSWPVSFLPQVNTRPSVAITMHMDVALPPHTFAMLMPLSVAIRVGSMMFGYWSSLSVLPRPIIFQSVMPQKRTSPSLGPSSAIVFRRSTKGWGRLVCRREGLVTRSSKSFFKRCCDSTPACVDHHSRVKV